ncbi:thiamine ABC transporter substrate-binding protein [Clostridium folliculivorans]|uniref:Thiamine ABC transporter substrate-binding protein n=1 Tax=Clostridium folliculivorans TaxID=2886038 RepID=A0A9W5Y2V2_9CLOT|nr:ABC-F family ATP-binding cassette domain-containing protein [Clostridium folliculivorans]GKU25719.1 thiamine ABC transporter substrate-binding protein [Clostridium folliculivorans]
MIILSCKNIKKSFGIDEILKDVTFNINEGEKVGLIGANGEGKSTLFRILTREVSYDSGEVFIDKNSTLGYLSQHLALENFNTIMDEMLIVFSDLMNLEKKLKNIEEKMNEPYDSSKQEYHDKLIKDYTQGHELYENRGGYIFRGEISRVLKGLGFTEEDFDKPINVLSGGQKTRVALCKLLLIKPELLLLDEPTNHLDLDAIEWLEEYLKNYKGTVLVISHDRFFLDGITTHTYELINGHVNCYNAPYTKYLELRKKDYDAKLKAFNLQQSEIKRQEDIIEKFRSFNREKSIRAAESRQKALDKMEKMDAPDREKNGTRISFHSQIKSGNDVIHVENLSKRYSDKLLFEDVNFDLRRGDKVALIGENGRGKTTLFKIIMEDIKADSGITYLGKNVFLGYYDQEQSNLNLEKTVIDEVWDEFPKMSTTEIRTALASFLFFNEDVFKKIENLSGGERCRINLLKLMLSKSNFLLLDEPTNHLDIMSREALEDAILDYDGTLIVISHDRYFLNKVINKIYELEQNGIKEYLGNYNYYTEKKKNPNRYEGLEEEQLGKTKTQIKEERKKKKEAEKLEKENSLKLKNLEKDISILEEKLLKLQEDLCLEEVYSNPTESEKVNKEILSTQVEIDCLYEQWEELEANS